LKPSFALWTLSTAALVVGLGCDTRRSSREGSSWQAPAHETPIRIVATDNGYEAPASVAPGLRHVVYANHGTEIHEAMFVKLPENMSALDFVAAVKAGSLFPKGALDYSGAGLTSPGETVEVWLRLDPGRYILVCWIGDHATTRPVHSLSVEGVAADDATPKEDVVLRMFDYRFELDGVLKKGPQILRVETPGPSMHEADLFRLQDGETIGDMNRWYKTEGEGLPPMQLAGGVLDNHDITRVVWLERPSFPGATPSTAGCRWRARPRPVPSTRPMRTSGWFERSRSRISVAQ